MNETTWAWPHVLLIIWIVFGLLAAGLILFLAGGIAALGHGATPAGYWLTAFLLAVVGGMLWPIVFVAYVGFMWKKIGVRALGDFFGIGPWLLGIVGFQYWQKIRYSDRMVRWFPPKGWEQTDRRIP